MIRKFFRVVVGVCFSIVFYVFPGQETELVGQQTQPAKDTINLKQQPVRFNKDLGVAMARIGEGRLRQLDATLVEIPPGRALAPVRLLAEEMIYIVSGRGHTLLWNRPGGKKERYEWKEGDLLSPTMNAWRQHVNESSTESARYLAVSTAPLTRKMFHNQAFVNSIDFSFDERWKQSVGREPKYTPGAEGPEVVRMMLGHLLPDIKNRELLPRGNNATGVTITPYGDMAGNYLLEMELREYMTSDASSPVPGHRQLWEAVFVVLKGVGYALVQRDGEAQRRFDWKEGDLYIIDPTEFHSDQAGGRPGARRLQIKPTGYFRDVGIEKYLMQSVPAGWRSSQ